MSNRRNITSTAVPRRNRERATIHQDTTPGATNPEFRWFWRHVCGTATAERFPSRDEAALDARDHVAACRPGIVAMGGA